MIKTFRVNAALPVSLTVITVALLLVTPISQGQGEDSHQLSTAEIELTFADVLDNARVMDTDNSTAENHWFADGRFVSRWKTGNRSGVVHGQWSAKENKRCIVIQSGLPDVDKQSKCGPIVKQGANYLSFNADGSVHGIHTLSPLLASDVLVD